MPKCHFVIPAGGVGLRFGGPLPKQFVEVEGLPILMHTLRAIAPYAESITLALPRIIGSIGSNYVGRSLLISSMKL